jgi:hypothetical protein
MFIIFYHLYLSVYSVPEIFSVATDVFFDILLGMLKYINVFYCTYIVNLFSNYTILMQQSIGFLFYRENVLSIFR